MKKILSVFILFCMVIVLGTSCNDNKKNESEIKNYEEIKLEKEYKQIEISHTEESIGFISEDGSVDLIDKDFKVKKNLKLEIEGKKTETSEYILYPGMFFDGKNIYVDNSNIGENEIKIYDTNGELLKSLKFDNITYIRKMHNFEDRTFFELGKGEDEERTNEIAYFDEKFNFVEVPGLEFVKNMNIANSFKVDENSFTIVCMDSYSGAIKIATIKDDLTFEISEDDMNKYNNSNEVPYYSSSLYVKSTDTFYRSSMPDFYLEKLNKDGSTEIVSEDIEFNFAYNVNEVFYLVKYKDEGVDKIFKSYPLKETKKAKNENFITVYRNMGSISMNEAFKYAKDKMKEDGIDVVFVDMDLDTYSREVNLKLSAGDKDIDLFVNDSLSNYKYISNSYTDNLNDYKYFMKSYKKNINKSVNNVVTFDKKIYGVPLEIQSGVQVAINEENLLAKGIQVPKNVMEYDEFLKFAKEVKEKDPDSFPQLCIMHIVYLYNYIEYNYDEGINTIDKEELKKIFIEIKELFEGKEMYAEPNENSNILPVYRVDEKNAKYFTPLKEVVIDRNNPKTSAFSFILSVYNGSEKKDWCEKFLTYFIEEENLTLNTDLGQISIPKNFSIYKDKYKDSRDYYEYLGRLRDAIDYSSENSKSKYVADISEVDNLINGYISGEIEDVSGVVNSIYEIIDKKARE